MTLLAASARTLDDLPSRKERKRPLSGSARAQARDSIRCAKKPCVRSWASSGFHPGVAGTKRLVSNKFCTVPIGPLTNRQALFAIRPRRAPSSSEWRRTDLRAWFPWGMPQARDIFVSLSEDKQAEYAGSAFVRSLYFSALGRM